MQDPFQCGFFTGFIFAGILGFIMGRIREARVRFGDIHRPMNTFSDASQPTLTAFGVYIRGLLGIVGCLLWVLILSLFLNYFFRYVYPAIHNFALGLGR